MDNHIDKLTLSTAETNEEMVYEPEPIEGRIRPYIPWEPTPLRPRNVSEHQEAVRRQHLDILEKHKPGFVTPMLYQFIETMYWHREANRSTKNIESYRNSLYALSDVPDPLLHQYVSFADAGEARPTELLYIMDKLGMSSIELAKLTHSYGYRLEHLPDMRKSVQDSILSAGGEYYQNPEESFKIEAFDQSVNDDQPCIGVMMRRKRKIGTTASADIFERSSFIVNLYRSSHLDSELIKTLQNFIAEAEFHHNSDISGDVYSLAYAIANQNRRFDTAIKAHMDADDFETLIPLSTTIWAANEETNRKVLEKARIEVSQ